MYTVNSKILQTPMTDGSILLLQPELGLYFELNEVSAVIFQALNKKELPKDILDKILNDYQVSRYRLEQDFEDLIQQLLKNGIIQQS